jgi:membrane protease YdiL (CAAX protease family)
MVVSVTSCVALLILAQAYARIAGAHWMIDRSFLWLLLGLFAQAGIAEETLFRGYLFGHLRRGRSFWIAGPLSMLPFVAVHTLLFFTLPIPIAFAALVLAIVISFPMARLFELGGSTIWPSALLHLVVQGTPKIVILPADEALGFSLFWMAASLALPLLILLAPQHGKASTIDAVFASSTVNMEK